MSNNLQQLSPLSLAFVGDAVFELEIRKMLSLEANRPINDLHKKSVEYVNAASQAKFIKKLLPLLSEEEEAVFRRGRNAHTGHTPKNQSEGDYHYATGFEALFGYLYLGGKQDRIDYFMNIIRSEKNE